MKSLAGVIDFLHCSVFKAISMRNLFPLCVTLWLSVHAVGENWPNWRGPSSDGLVSGSGYPTEWSATDNIAWKTKLPGWGTSTPAIWEQRIFVSCCDEDAGKNTLVCLDRSGMKTWEVEVGDAIANKNRKASGANPSPITDGEHVYAYFKSGDLACVTLDGQTVWKTNLQSKFGEDLLNWDLGTSPVLTRKNVVVAVMHQGPSYLVALDKATGDVIWKQDRDLGAPAEARDSYSTPIVMTNGDREELIVLGADHVTAHDAATGAEIWRAGALNPNQQRNFRSIASPVVADGMIIAPYARGATLTAVRLGGAGDVTDSRVAWTTPIASDVPTPVFYQGKVYVCGDRGDITCIDVATGAELWTESLPRNRNVYSASPVIADGNLYATREDGATFVLKLGDAPKLIAENSIHEYTLATPAFADGHIFLRASEHLYCIGKK